MSNVKLKETVCEFCGQVLMPGQECDCAGAVTDKQKKCAVETAKQEIQELVPEWPEEYKNILFEGIDNIIFNELKTLTIEDDYGIKVKLQSQSKSFIKIDRTDTNKLSVTI